jgi:hypothetical protein
MFHSAKALNSKIGAWDSSKEMTHFWNCEKALDKPFG